MLKQNSIGQTNQTPSEQDSFIIPDPWNETDTGPAIDTRSIHWKIPTEAHPLIRPAGDPTAPPLPSSTLRPIEVLLQDEMKLRGNEVQFLKTKIQDFFALLYWLDETTGQSA